MRLSTRFNWQLLPFLFMCLGILYFIVDVVYEYSGGKLVLIMIFSAGAIRMFFKNRNSNKSISQ